MLVTPAAYKIPKLAIRIRIGSDTIKVMTWSHASIYKINVKIAMLEYPIYFQNLWIFFRNRRKSYSIQDYILFICFLVI